MRQLKEEKEQEEERNPTKIGTFLKDDGEEAEKKVVLENNFFKAKMDVKSLIKQKTLQEFLEENYIQEYLPALTANGILDLETLRCIFHHYEDVTRDRLAELGVKAGHQVKIIKKINEEFDKMLNTDHHHVQPPLPQKVESGYGEGDVNSYAGEATSSDLPLESPIDDNSNAYDQEESEDAEE